MIGGRPATEPGAVSFTRRAWLPPLLFGATALGVFLVFAASGRVSESHGDRVLGAFSPAFSAVGRGGSQFLEWTWGHLKTIGYAVTAGALALAGRAHRLREFRTAGGEQLLQDGTMAAVLVFAVTAQREVGLVR